VMKRRLGKRLPEFTVEEKAQIKGSTDFFGLNHYTTHYAAYMPADQMGETDPYGNGGISEDQDVQLSSDPEWKTTGVGWNIVPWGCRKLLHWIDQRYGRPEIVITENGCVLKEDTDNGLLEDTERIEFLEGYLTECHRAIEEGVKLKGYFVWTFMDNFEWAFGTTMRFGINRIDFETQERTPKASVKWYSEVIRNNAL